MVQHLGRGEITDTPVLSADYVKAEAARLGFFACTLARAERVDANYERTMRTWLAKGYHGDMAYMEKHLALRLDPRLLLDGARTVVVVAMNYYTAPAFTDWQMARYALGRDYHDVMRERLNLLRRSILEKFAVSSGFSLPLSEEFVMQNSRVCVDTAPIDERYWAIRSGMGWRGRSCQLILPHGGTFFFLGALLLTAGADGYGAPLPNRCGTCHACVDACPARALLGDGTMDARRCLSYLTIEHRGPLPEGTAAQMGACFYGCDRCAEACPWNRKATPTQEAAFQPKPELMRMTMDDWRHLTVEQYRALFKGSAVKRAKYEGLMRNIRAVTSAENPDETEKK